MQSFKIASIVSKKDKHLQANIVFTCKHCEILSIKYLCVSLGTLKRILIAVFNAVYNFETHFILGSTELSKEFFSLDLTSLDSLIKCIPLHQQIGLDQVDTIFRGVFRGGEGV